MIGPTKLCPKGIALIFVDLDDTVLVDGTKIMPRVVDALNLARERGCMACVASGRALHMVPQMVREPRTMDYLICSNGARVHDTIGGVLYESLMTPQQVLEAMDQLDPLEPGWNAFVGDQSYFEWRGLSYLVTGHRERLTQSDPRKALHTGAGLLLRDAARNVRKVARFGKRVLFKRDNMMQVKRVRPYIEATDEGIAKVGCSLPSPEACERAMDILDYLGDFEVARMSPFELEITAKGTTKGVAARWLMDYLDIDPECSVAFGDSENDATLADACGTFVAMENGDDRIKQLADDVCESVYDDGVARWLERAMAEADGANHV
ncbi:MAG: HAD family phosphatase [Atopobiaceae bacterium]|nr:HAD family phosphatase [Atopobiaceae bacterium]